VNISIFAFSNTVTPDGESGLAEVINPRNHNEVMVVLGEGVFASYDVSSPNVSPGRLEKKLT
jgi:hypothetical protein